MPFNDAREFWKQYAQQRHDALRDGQRLRWSTSDVAKLTEVEDKYKTDEENQEWKTQTSKKTWDWNKLIGTLNKIGWMCGHRRDFRKQFLAHGSEPRVPLDFVRFETLRLLFTVKQLDVLKDMIEIYRKEIK